MGTRADFYVGRGPDAEWIGSTAWDGYPDGFGVNPVGDFNQALSDIKRVIKNLDDFDWKAKGLSFEDAMVLIMNRVPLERALKTLKAYKPKGKSRVTYPMFTATTEEAFRAAIAEHVAVRDDFTSPDEGWPWPWNDSEITDYAYAFDDGKVWGYGPPWFDVAAQLAETPEESEARIERANAEYEKTGYVRPEDRNNPFPFPDMSARKNVQRGSTKGGIITIGRTASGQVVLND